MKLLSSTAVVVLGSMSLSAGALADTASHANCGPAEIFVQAEGQPGVCRRIEGGAAGQSGAEGAAGLAGIPAGALVVGGVVILGGVAIAVVAADSDSEPSTGTTGTQ